MKVLIDIGNTRIKWCVEENGVIKTEIPIAYKQIDSIDVMQQRWVNLATPTILAISSVSATQITLKITQLAKLLWPKVKVIVAKSSATYHTLTNAYQQPEKLGIDRWLGLIALQHYYPGNNCLVSCGTAITLDWINDKGQHLGGLISPGLQLMKQSLQQGTQHLPLSNQSFQVALSDSTDSAIFTGTLLAAAGLVEKSINKFGDCQTLVLTGGDADLIAKHLEIESIIEPDLVLKGLALFCNEEKL